jgi:hypothetical protein
MDFKRSTGVLLTNAWLGSDNFSVYRPGTFFSVYREDIGVCVTIVVLMVSYLGL